MVMKRRLFIKRIILYGRIALAVILILIIAVSDRELAFFWLPIILASDLVILVTVKLIQQSSLKAECLAYKRLEFIRKIAELAYMYGYNTDVFYRRICETMHLEELKKNSVMDFNFEMGKHRFLKRMDDLSMDDAEFYCLIKSGFTTRELSIILGHRNPKSIYVKKCRLMKKIKKQIPKDNNPQEDSVKNQESHV